MDSTKVLDNVFSESERGTMVMVEVDPAELVIDWEVNERHVQEIIDSLPAHGNRIVFPPYVYLRNHKIIDGLHRVVAAHRAGISSLQVVLVDVSESRFWDLRIMAAKPHHSIENERLYAWMETCWESDWGKDKPREAIAEHLWALFRGENYRQNNSLYAKIDRSKLQGEQAELYDWFASKSALWGIPVESLADRILKFWNVVNPNPEIDKIAIEHALSLPQRNKLQEETKKTPAKLPIVEKWVERGMQGTLADSGREQLAKKKAKKIAKLEADAQRHKPPPRQDSPAIQAQRRFIKVRDGINRAGDELRKVSALFKEVPESLALLAALMELISKYSEGVISIHDDAITNALAENARLYKENADLKIELASLRRASGSGITVPSETLAWSSVELSP